MRNFKLLIEYDGTNYNGWQRQENGRSIQGEIEHTFNQIVQESVTIYGAGRTDAGVHARGQVAHVHSQTSLTVGQLRGGLNAMLPDDIVIVNVEMVPEEFHARYNAKERHYSYLIALQPTALMRNYSWYVKYSLDLSLIQRATNFLKGTHDFESFCKANADVDHHCCSVREAYWEEDGTMLRFTIRADRFLHGMVRTIVGTMVDVGRGHLSFDDVTKILEKKNRSEAGMAAPAKGLTLEQVIY